MNNAMDSPVRVVVLPSGRRVTIGAYMAAWRRVAALPPHTKISDWQWYPVKACDVLRDMRAALDERISRHLPWWRRGRKWEYEWQSAARHCAHAANTPRLILDWVPREFRARLAHRIRNSMGG